MTTFRTYMLRKAYENVKKHGDRLAQADSLIDWEAFRPEFILKQIGRTLKSPYRMGVVLNNLSRLGEIRKTIQNPMG